MFNKDNFIQYLNASSAAQEKLELKGKSLFTCMCLMCKLKYNGNWKEYKKRYSSLIHNLVILQNRTKTILYPIIITSEFWNLFINFQLERGLCYSTATGNCTQLLSILDWSSKYGAEVSRSFRALDKYPYHIEQLALTPDEVSHIYHFDLNSVNLRADKRKNLERVRDTFVLACNLGQRYSDISRIDSSCFSGNMFQMISQKTKMVSCVDIDEMCIDKDTVYKILKKYGYRCPYKSDVGNFNHSLKELIKMIGFKDMVQRQVKVQGKIIDKSDYKYNLITSHTARRTFININIQRHKTSIEIRRATGHRTYFGYSKYLCYDAR